MKKLLTITTFVLILTSCHTQQRIPNKIVTTDIDNFWIAYDKITSTRDSALQYKYLDSLYIRRGTEGLKAFMEARNYTPQDYVNAINNYPKFWASIRENTLKAEKFGSELELGIEKLRQLYPPLKPATIYFTIGALRTGGTVMDSLVLIGSELAMADENTVSTEFPEQERTSREAFFNTNPIDNLVLLNVHEYVHTQQKPIVDNLLAQVIYEGVAEFVSVKAMGVPSAVPAIEYGKKNHEKVREKFEQEMFYPVNRSKWLWSSAPNDFGVRDLGYYIGYQMCEHYYEQATNKKEAIKRLIELDYTNETELEIFVDKTVFFSASLEDLHQNFEEKRPIATGIKQFENNSQTVSPGIKEITIEFSAPLNGRSSGISYGPLGEDTFPAIKERLWSKDATSFTVKVELKPNQHYQFVLDDNFRTHESRPLKPYLIEFKTTVE